MSYLSNDSRNVSNGVFTVSGNIVNNADVSNPVITQVQSDWNAASGLGVILNKPNISLYALDDNVVHKTTNEVIQGMKIFANTKPQNVDATGAGIWIKNLNPAWDSGTSYAMVTMRDQTDVSLVKLLAKKFSTNNWGVRLDGWNGAENNEVVTIDGSGNTVIGKNVALTDTRVKVIGYSDTLPLQEWGDGGQVGTFIRRTAGNVMSFVAKNYGGYAHEFLGNWWFRSNLYVTDTVSIDAAYPTLLFRDENRNPKWHLVRSADDGALRLTKSGVKDLVTFNYSNDDIQHLTGDFYHRDGNVYIQKNAITKIGLVGSVGLGGRASQLDMVARHATDGTSMRFTNYVDRDGAVVGNDTWQIWGYPTDSNGNATDFAPLLNLTYNRTTNRASFSLGRDEQWLDYTPSLVSTGGGAPASYTERAGKYKRFGSLVVAEATIRASSLAGLTAGVIGVSLPVPIHSAAGGEIPASGFICQVGQNPATQSKGIPVVNTSVNCVTFLSGVNTSSVSLADIDTSTVIRVRVIYNGSI